MVFGENKNNHLLYINIFHILLSIIIAVGLYRIASAYLVLLSGEELKNIESYSTISVLLFLGLIIFFIICKFRTHTTSLNLLYLFALFSIIPLIFYFDSFNLYFKSIIYSWLFILMFRYGYFMGFQDKQLTYKINSLLIISMAVLLPLCINSYIIHRHVNFLISNDAIFSLVVLLPLPILFKNKKISYLLLSIIIILAFFSLKRSVIGGVLLSMTIATIIIVMNNKKKYLIFIVVIMALIYGQSALMNTTIGYAIENRFDQGDSGRSDLQSIIIDQFEKSSTAEMIFGHGYGGTTKVIGVPAHNDFLEILYNYGFICLILYSATLLLFLYKVVVWYQYRNYFIDYYISFVVSIILLIFLSTFNCIITSMYGNVIFLIIGISYGKISSQFLSVKRR